MNIFLDTANTAIITRWKETGIVNGVTTNPSNLAKEGNQPLKVVKEICSIIGDEGYVSVEVTESDPHALFKQALHIADIAPNVVVKIPCYVPYYQTIEKLVCEGVPLNITLVFSLTQGLFMSKLGVEFISPFVGRLREINSDGIALVEDLMNMTLSLGYTTQVLAASIRTVDDFNSVIRIGADAITVSPEILEQATQHSLTQPGMEKFASDWAKIGVRQFP